MEECKAAARRTLDVIEKHLRLHPDDVRAVYFASGAWSTLGERERALECANRALEMNPEDSGVRYNVACVYAHEGLVDEALSLLEKNVAVGWGNLEWVKNDPDLDPLEVRLDYRSASAEEPADWSEAAVHRSTRGTEGGGGSREGQLVWQTASLAEGDYEIRAVVD